MYKDISKKKEYEKLYHKIHYICKPIMQRKCLVCNIIFTPDNKHHKQKYCSFDCRKGYKLSWARNKNGYTPPQLRQCVICKSTFMPYIHRPKSATCSRKCSSKLDFIRHREARLKKIYEWSRNNREKFYASLKKCRMKKPDQYRRMYVAKQHRRNAILKNIKGSFSRLEFERMCELLSYKCQGCMGIFQLNKLTVDHRIPISKNGTNYISNIQPLCMPCNAKKHDKFLPIGFNLIRGAI